MRPRKRQGRLRSDGCPCNGPDGPDGPATIRSFNHAVSEAAETNEIGASDRSARRMPRPPDAPEAAAGPVGSAAGVGAGHRLLKPVGDAPGRQADDRLRTAAARALQRQDAAVEFDQPRGDRQAEADAMLLPTGKWRRIAGTAAARRALLWRSSRGPCRPRRFRRRPRRKSSAISSTTPPAGENLMALSSRLVRTCRIACASTSSGGRRGSILAVTVTARSRQRPETRSCAESARSWNDVGTGFSSR